MKKLLVMCYCFLLSFNFLKAQSNYNHYGVGYYMNLGSVAGLDDFVNRYNASRNAEQGIETFNLNGWEVGCLLDLNSDKISDSFSEEGFSRESQYSFMELGYFQSSKAQSLELTSGFQEDFRIRLRGGYLGGGTSIMNYGDFQLLAGFRTYIGLMKAHTRVADAATINGTDWNEVYSDLYVDLSIGLKIAYRGFWIEPYYIFNTDAVLDWMIDFESENIGLNPLYEGMNVPNFGAERFRNLKGFGLRFRVGI